MKQLISSDADDVQQDISGEKSIAGLSLPHARVLLTSKEESQLWRKVDLKLMPIVALMYLFCFMDRANIGNAKLDGLMTQLKLSGNQYNVALTVFFISFSLFDLPANYIIQFVPPSKWLAGTVILWGIVMMLMGFVKTYPQLAGVRFCLGIAESGFYAGVAYYLTMWYPKYMLQRRFAIFLGAATSAGAFSGLLAYGINFMNGDRGYQGWSWIFMLEGIATVVIGFVALFVMVDYPSTVKFLTPKEKQYIIQRRGLGDMYRANVNHGAPLRNHILSPNDYQQLRIQHISDLVIVLLVVAYFSDKAQLRSPFIFASQTIALVGFIINITNVPNGVKYFGTYLCVAGPYTGGVGSIIW
ncbi:major facilitator superfamily domain-containing protein [Pisolithus marmoratus]|nr:major facilitator superfamily domain-containing protein [Pisolithus marmoratus]